MAVTGLRLERLLDVDPQDALPRGTHTPQRRPALIEEYIAGRHDTEFYRMRTRPELYDEWMLDITFESRQAQARVTGQLNADCHACRATTLVTPDATQCPRCGCEFQ